ncbi:hypothetical protein PoB_004294000 [Plakobranchus ocellatus]|uniref:Uncharacterized protein n=1 Tax=Plakobranchus ocellatus TaxID=259542 RepID=A0AAV4B759_9GAST|nr:hypothetical protein PoB_004294000 [Plakobranchus ocellatus]
MTHHLCPVESSPFRFIHKPEREENKHCHQHYAKLAILMGIHDDEDDDIDDNANNTSVTAAVAITAAATATAAIAADGSNGDGGAAVATTTFF